VPDLLWERGADDVLPVDEFVEDGTIVVRAELPGIDPEKDLEVRVPPRRRRGQRGAVPGRGRSGLSAPARLRRARG